MAGPPPADASQVEAKIYVLSILRASSILTDGWTSCNISAEDTYPRKCWIRHFLGLTHFCGETRNGRFIVKRKTQRKRMIRKLKQLRLEMRRRMHTPVKDQWQWV